MSVGKDNPYLLPKTVYNRVLWVVRDYERLKSERQNILHSYDCDWNGLPRGGGVGNPTEDKALQLERFTADLEAIEQALLLVDEDMREGVLNNIYYRASYPHTPSLSTWIRRKQKFLYDVAKNLKLV